MNNRRPARLLFLTFVLLLTCVTALSAVCLPTGTAKAVSATDTGCQITYTVAAQWPASAQAPGGFEASLSILNTGSTTITGWTLHFTFSNGQIIFSHFGGGDLTQTGASITITNLSFNGTIAPGATVLYAPGFNANWWGSNSPPASITLNDTICSLVIH